MPTMLEAIAQERSWLREETQRLLALSRAEREKAEHLVAQKIQFFQTRPEWDADWRELFAKD